jgi:hypothetical protein
MLILLETRSVSWAESLRIALLANGIEAVMLDQYSPGTLGLMGSLRVAIVDESALPRAATLVGDLHTPVTEPLPSWWWHKRALVLLSAGLVMLYLATRLSESASMRTLEFLLTVGSAIVFTGGFTLLFLGYWADRRQTTGQSEGS